MIVTPCRVKYSTRTVMCSLGALCCVRNAVCGAQLSQCPPGRPTHCFLQPFILCPVRRRRRDDSFARPRFSCFGIWCFTSRRRTTIVSFRGDVHPQNAGHTALSPYAVDVAGQHLTERFSPWRTLLHPRGKHSRAPTTTFARPAQPLLARLLGRRPSFVHSSPCIPLPCPSPPLRTEQAILKDQR